MQFDKYSAPREVEFNGRKYRRIAAYSKYYLAVRKGRDDKPKGLHVDIWQFHNKSTVPGIRLITTLKTWSVYRVACIEVYLRLILIGMKNYGSWLKLDHLLWNGIVQKLAVNGIGIMQKIPFANQNQERNLMPTEPLLKVLDNAIGAEMIMNTKALDVNFADLIAKARKADGDAESQISSPIILKPVFNLSVDEPHCYFANGVLVHNCDTFTQALIYLRIGGWAGAHPDDDEGYNEPLPLDDEDGDYITERVRAPYGA
jgi:hypothetical protein